MNYKKHGEDGKIREFQAFFDKIDYQMLRQNLGACRKKSGISQETFAEVIGVDRKTISRIENECDYNTNLLKYIIFIELISDKSLLETIERH